MARIKIPKESNIDFSSKEVFRVLNEVSGSKGKRLIYEYTDRF